MNLIDVIEMVCDWRAAADESGKSIHDGLAINATRFRITPQLESVLRNTVQFLDEGMSD